MRLYERMESGIYMIAEMSANHGGKIENALRFVREAKLAGADCVKIQTYTADTLTIPCKKDQFIIKEGLWKGYSYYELYKEAYMPWEWQPRIKEECERVGIDFLSTPFDHTAVDFLESMGIECYKIASFELIDLPLIEYVASKGKPMILSCGMASVEEIEEAIAACTRQNNNRLILLKCCSQYPAKLEQMNLQVITDMKQHFQVPIGLSDHSMGSLAPIVAASLGAQVIEKHVCLDRTIKSADVAFSMTMQEFSSMVQQVRKVSVVKGTVSYELTEEEKKSLLCRRSLYAVQLIHKGDVFTQDNVRSIRPGYGLKPKYYHQLMGKESRNTYEFGDPIKEEELT